MKMVYLIEEEMHGGIGIAKNYPFAIKFLIDNNWIDGNFEFYDVDCGDTKTIVEDLGENWKEVLFSWDTETFNNYFDGLLYLTLEEVYGTD